MPVVNCLPKTYPIASIKQETAHVKTFTFPVSFKAKPGQFLMVWLPGVDEVPMSIAMDDGTETKVTFFDVGDMTKQLFQKNTGDLIGLRGPFGTHYEWQPKQHLILVAGGYGAAPMYFVAKEALKDHCRIDFIVGARSKEHLLYLEEIQKLPHTQLHVSTDDGSMGYKGRNTEVLETLLQERGASTWPRDLMLSKPVLSRVEASKHVAGPAQHDVVSVFACGPELMLKKISQICAEKKTSCFMSLERYMKCGYGLCGNCVMDPLGIRLCTDGPVVSNDLCVQLTDFGVYHRDALGKKHVF
ncbi:MAG: hypothetical protein AAB853_05930 [Patescibacteria group bacterium]